MFGGGIQAVVSLVLRGKDEGAGGLFDSVAGKAGALNTAALGLAAGGLAVVAGALIAGGKAAFDFSQEVDGAMRLVEAQTGLTGDALGDFEQQAKDVFLNNWGDDFGDVAQAMSTVRQATWTSGDALEAMTEQALVARDVLGEGVATSIDAAKVLMDEFGVSSEQAFDFMIAGQQRGLNRSGDLLDTISEYGNLFSDAGFTATGFFSILETGGAGGVLGTDKIADSIKEMNIRLNEGASGVAESFDAIGLNFDQISDTVASGEATWADYFSDIVQGIDSIDDPIAKSQAQVGIFGTMAEDLGTDMTFFLDDYATGWRDIEGATAGAAEALSGGWENAWSRFKRQAVVALEPVGDLLGAGLERATPYLEAFGVWLGEKIPVAIETTKAFFEENGPAITAFFEQVWVFAEPVLAFLEDKFGNALPERLAIFKTVWEENITPIWWALQAGWETVAPALAELADYFGVGLPEAGMTATDMFETYFQPGLKMVTDFLVDPVIPALADLVVWLSENIPVAVEAVEEWFNTKLVPAFETAKNFLLEQMVPRFEELYDWLFVKVPSGVAETVDRFNDRFSEVQAAVQPARDFLFGFFDRVKDFAGWLSSTVFSFNIDLPSLPEWALPGSPLRLHTAWANFDDFLQSAVFEPDMRFAGDFMPPDERAVARVGNSVSFGVVDGGGLVPLAAGGGVHHHHYSIVIEDQRTGMAMLEYFRSLRR